MLEDFKDVCLWAVGAGRLDGSGSGSGLSASACPQLRLPNRMTQRLCNSSQSYLDITRPYVLPRSSPVRCPFHNRAGPFHNWEVHFTTTRKTQTVHFTTAEIESIQKQSKSATENLEMFLN